MKRRVGAQRHAAVRHFIAHLLKLLALAIAIEFAPFREIQKWPRFVDVIDDKPGHRRDIRVPGPRGFV